MNNLELLKCPVCYCDYDKAICEPIVLPECGHTLCHKCLRQILLIQPAKCPLDRKTITSYNFPANQALSQLIDQRSSAVHGICSLHQEPRTLFCLTDKVKICPSCVDGKDDAVHYGHEAKPLSEIQREAKKKTAELKADVTKLETNQKTVAQIFEEKKKEAFGLKKRKFDMIRSFVDAKEHEVSSEIGLLFAQKKTKTEQQFKKDQTLKQQIQIHLTALHENKLDETFFDALNKSGIKEKVFIQREKLELESLTRKLEDELNLAEGNINKSLVSVFDKFGPEIYQIRTKEGEISSKTVDEQRDMLLYVDSLVKVRRKGELVEIFHQDKGRTEEDIKNDLLSLNNFAAGVKSVKLNLARKKITEEILFALSYLWKHMKDITCLSFELSRQNSTSLKDHFMLFENNFWVSDQIESFSLVSKNPFHHSTQVLYDEASITKVFNTIVKMTNLKHFSLSLNENNITDQVLRIFADQVIPVLAKVETLKLDFSETNITDTGIQEMCTKAKGVLQKIKSFSLNLKDTKITVKSLLSVVKDALPSSTILEKFSLSVTYFDYQASQMEFFWETLKPLIKNVKSFSLSFPFSSVTDSSIKIIAMKVLSIMPLLESLKLDLMECEHISSVSIENILKYAADLTKLKKLRLHFGGNYVTDYGIKMLANELLPKAPKIENLQLLFAANSFGDSGVNELWKSLIPISQNLRVFNFSLALDITEPCFEFFCRKILPKMSSLTKLIIEGSCFSSEDSHRIFFESLKTIGPNIEDLQLILDGCECITDEVFAVFIEDVLPYMNSLRRLKFDISDTNITWDTIEDLSSKLKKLLDLEYIDINYIFDEMGVTGNELESLRDDNPDFDINLEGIAYH